MASNFLSRAEKAHHTSGALAGSEKYPGEPAITVIRLRGRIDRQVLEKLDAEIGAALGREPSGTIVADLGEVTELSPAGVGYLAALQKNLRSAGADLVLSSPGPESAENLRILGFDTFFAVARDIDSAIDYIRRPGDRAYPAKGRCPACGGPVMLRSAGRFRCMGCSAVLVAGPGGEISAG